MMKFNLLFFVLTFMFLKVSSQNINFPDANFKEALLGTNSNNYVLCYDENGTNIHVDQNNDGEIQLSEAAMVYSIDFRQISNYSTLEGLNFFVNLESMYYVNDGMSSHIHGKIDDIKLNGLNNLKTVNLSGCNIGNLSIKNCPNLLDVMSAFKDSYNSSPSYYISGNTEKFTIESCPLINKVVWTNNNLKFVSINNNPNLKHLELRGNSLVTFDASSLTNLEYLDVSNNQQELVSGLEEANFDPSLTSINIEGLSKLKVLNTSNQSLSNLNLTDLSMLEILDCKNNKIANPLDLSQSSKITYLDCSANQIKSISLPNISDISTFYANNNLLENEGLDFAKLFAVKNIDRTINLSFNNFNQNITLSSPIVSFASLDLSNNKISDFKISGTFSSWPGQAQIFLNDNVLENIDFGSINSLSNLYVLNNPLTKIDAPNLEVGLLDFSNTNISYIKLNPGNTTAAILIATGLKSSTLKLNCHSGGVALANCQSLETIDLSDSRIGIEQIQDMPLLKSIYIKNGFKDPIYSPFFNTPNLKFICADEEDIKTVNDQLFQSGLTNVNVNSYCSFTPGGNYNTISGTVRIDDNNNGCDTNDDPFQYLKLKINDGTNSGETFVQSNGKYEFYTQAGNFNLSALTENSALFSVSPANFSAGFTDNNNNVFTQDICITANGNKNDAEVVIAPLTIARPGFDAVYKLVWRNKGNTVLSGKVIMNYDSGKMTFKSSSLPYSVISSGSIEFNYTNLKPYANTASEITFTINTPTDSTNPVNMGDVLSFNAQITPNNIDITPEDNNFSFNHTVTNSFDPNDIVCLEGDEVPVSFVGKYVHYAVNFENKGNAEAENIVVKMKINPDEFDINTLQLQNASADVSTKVNGDIVEFVFEKIKLKSGGHGGVLLKIKTKSNLVEGDEFKNKADIYFDYNFPVETNNYVTTIYDANNVLAAKINYTASGFLQNNYKVNFDASLSTGSIVSYKWEFSGNPTISSTTAVNPTATYTTPGDYTVKLTVSDAEGVSSTKILTFNIGGNIADISTGKNSDNNLIVIDSDEDDWKGYDINNTEITPKVRHTYTGWSSAELDNGNTSQWITLNNAEGYYNYKSREFTIPDNAVDAKLNLRSLSFVRNWTYLVKINSDGSETETEITKTQYLGDGFKGWLNSRSPKVDNLSLSPGRYYIKVLVYSNNSNVRESLDVNAMITCSAGLINANKKAQISSPTLDSEISTANDISVYPIPAKKEINILADDIITNVEVYDSLGRITQKRIFSNKSKKVEISLTGMEGVYYLKIKTKKGIITQKIIKE